MEIDFLKYKNSKDKEALIKAAILEDDNLCNLIRDTEEHCSNNGILEFDRIEEIDSIVRMAKQILDAEVTYFEKHKKFDIYFQVAFVSCGWWLVMPTEMVDDKYIYIDVFLTHLKTHF